MIARMSGHKMNSIFPNVREGLLSGILIYADYPTPPDNQLREYLIGEKRPDILLSEIEEEYGDGVFRLVGIGGERDSKGDIVPVERDTRTIRVAKGIEPRWTEKVQSMIDRTMTPRTEMPRHDRHDYARHEPQSMHGLPSGTVAMSPDSMFGGMVGGAGPFSGGMGSIGMNSGGPISVPLGEGEVLVMAPGISNEDMQSRIDRAQAEIKERRESKTMNEMLMAILNAQLQSAQQAAAKAEQRASATEEKLMSIVLGGGAPGAPVGTPGDSANRALQDTIEHQRRQIADMEERSRRDRSDHWDEIDRWKRRCAEIEDQFRGERRKNEELIAKLAKADIDAMVAGAKGPGGDSDEEKTQRKIAMFAQLAQNLAPVAGPILAKLGIIGGPDAAAAAQQQQQIQMQQVQQMPSGDVMQPPMMGTGQ